MDIIYSFHGYILPGFLMEKAQKEKEKTNVLLKSRAFFSHQGFKQWTKEEKIFIFSMSQGDAQSISLSIQNTWSKWDFCFKSACNSCVKHL